MKERKKEKIPGLGSKKHKSLWKGPHIGDGKKNTPSNVDKMTAMCIRLKFT